MPSRSTCPSRRRAAGAARGGADEVPEHRHGGEEIADQDGPPHERADHRAAERAAHAEEERLEAREEDHDRDEQSAGSRSLAAMRLAATMPNAMNARPCRTV